MLIQEDDIRLFRIISIGGVCTIEQSKTIYSGRAEYYHYLRVRRLVEDGYLDKHGKYLELTGKSSSLIGETKYRFRNEGQKPLQCEISKIVMGMTEVETVSNRKLRNKYSLDRRTNFKGAFVLNQEEYFFYFLPSKTSLQLATFIKSELRTLSIGGICRKSIIFVSNPETMKFFSGDDSKQVELLLLPYPGGVEILNSFYSSANQGYLATLMPGAVATKMPFANYESPDCYYTILILNDIAKRSTLAAYYESPGQKRPVKIICLDTQKTLYTNKYPRAEIISIQESKFRKKS